MTAVNCWGRQQLLSQMMQSYSCFWEFSKRICLCQLNMQLKGIGFMYNDVKVNCLLHRTIVLYFQVGSYSKERETGGRWSRTSCIIFHIWYVKHTWLSNCRMKLCKTGCKLTASWFQLDANKNVLWLWTECKLIFCLGLSWCWQEHALGFDQFVSKDMAGPSC